MAAFVSTSAQSTVEVDGLSRSYYLHIPEDMPEGAPLVFVLHGYGGTASEMMNSVGINQIADEKGFAACYPQGTKGPWGDNAWNAGYTNQTVDDVNFLSTLVSYLQEEHGLSKQSTFSTGISNGGDMSYLLACQRPDISTAVAPVAGCLMNWIFDSCQESLPVSVFEIHGTRDNITLWEGDPSYASVGRPGYMSTSDMIGFWVEKNQCTQNMVDTLPDPDGGDFVISEKHTGGIDGNEVWLYTIVGGGHDWPGVWGTDDINASEEIWKFFSQFINTNVSGSMHRGKGEIRIFPNPVNNRVTIKTGGASIEKVMLHNSLGMCIPVNHTISQESVLLSMEDMIPGIYIVQLYGKSSGKKESFRIYKR